MLLIPTTDGIFILKNYYKSIEKFEINNNQMFIYIMGGNKIVLDVGGGFVEKIDYYNGDSDDAGVLFICSDGAIFRMYFTDDKKRCITEIINKSKNLTLGDNGVVTITADDVMIVASAEYYIMNEGYFFEAEKGEEVSAFMNKWAWQIK